jgi:tetratricopeptide (TPR) repeat protein
VSNLLAGLLGALLATNQPAAVSNLISQRLGAPVEAVDAQDPVEKEYRRLLAEDDAAQAEVYRWSNQPGDPAPSVGGATNAPLKVRAAQRFEPVRKSYEDFLQRHPDHARGRLAYGSFLNEIGEEQAAATQWEKARDIDSRLPAVWNNLGNYYGHNGQVALAFGCYDKAIALSPGESVYYQNLATTAFLFRKEGREHYGLTEQQLFNRVMALYRKAQSLDPGNFALATEVAQTYYGFKPPVSGVPEDDQRAEKEHYDLALEAWQVALKLAGDDLEEQSVRIHLARVNLSAGRLEEARRNLDLVTNAVFTSVKERLQKKLAGRETDLLSAPPVSLRP